jgi:hypothetical protein
MASRHYTNTDDDVYQTVSDSDIEQQIVDYQENYFDDAHVDDQSDQSS